MLPVVRSGGRGLLSDVPLQKPPCFLFFPDLCRRLRIQRVHARNLLLGHLRETPDEVDEPPALPLSFGGTISPGRHTGEANAMLDDGEQFAVR